MANKDITSVPNVTDYDTVYVKENGEISQISKDTFNKPLTDEVARATKAENANASAINTKLNKTDVANNLTTTTTGKALDATQGKALNDLLIGITNPTWVTPTVTSSNRCTVVSGGYMQIGNMVIVDVAVQATMDLYGNDYWFLIGSFPKPLGGACGITCKKNNNNSAYRDKAYIQEKSLAIGLDSISVSKNDVYVFSGIYWTA